MDRTTVGMLIYFLTLYVLMIVTTLVMLTLVFKSGHGVNWMISTTEGWSLMLGFSIPVALVMGVLHYVLKRLKMA